MRAVVVHAHPDPESFSAHLFHTAVGALTRAGHTVQALDLYADGFEAGMSAAERSAYETPEPILDPLVRRYADAVAAAEVLVFVYPTWWWGLPAVMKGFLDRVFVSGVAFGFDPNTNKLVPGLRGLRHLVGVSTYGSARGWMRLFNDAGRRQLLRCVRVLAPLRRCRSHWLACYSMDTSTDAVRLAFAARVDAVLGAL